MLCGDGDTVSQLGSLVVSMGLSNLVLSLVLTHESSQSCAPDRQAQRICDPEPWLEEDCGKCSACPKVNLYLMLLKIVKPTFRG